MLDDFKTFLLRGNVIELAVAFVIGAASQAVISSLVEDILTPIVTAIVGEPDFSNLKFTVNGSVFRYGSFVNAALSFAFVAAAVFFFVVRPVNAIVARQRLGEDPDDDETKSDEAKLLAEIRDELRARRAAG